MNILNLFRGLPILAVALTLPAWSGGLDVNGVPNFHQVSDKVYRGGQPTAEGFKDLAKLGVKTIVDLRRPDEHSTAEEQRLVTAAGMKYVNIPMKGVVSPTEAQIAQALGLLTSSTDPIFVHCKRGADRTGTVVACYRMSHDKSNNKKALSEAKSLGMSWTQFGLKSYVKSYRPGAPTLTAVPAVAVPTLSEN